MRTLGDLGVWVWGPESLLLEVPAQTMHDLSWAWGVRLNEIWGGKISVVESVKFSSTSTDIQPS